MSTEDVENLECSSAIDDELAVADESEVVVDVVGGILTEDNLEAGGIVGIC